MLTGSLSGNPLSFTYTPNAGFVGNEVIAFNVTDDEGVTTSGSVVISVITKLAEVKDVAGIATAISSSFAIYTLESLGIELSTAVDDTTIQVTGQPANGTLTGALSGESLSLSYISTEQYVGNDTINFNVVDSEGNSAPGVISITVLAKPVVTVDVAAIAAATSGQYSTFSGVDIALGLISSTDGVVFEITDLASNGVLTGSLKGNPVAVIYTPNDDFVGEETIAFTVTGNNGESAAGMMTITVMDIINTGIDSDGDGLSDFDEINVYGTSPTLPDTDADGFSDYQEVITYGFDSSTNNFRFNPLIADMPQLQVNITSAPDIYINYTNKEGSTSTESITNTNGSNTIIGNTQTTGNSNSVTKAHSEGIEIGAELETSVGLTGGVTAKYSLKINANQTETTAKGDSYSSAIQETTDTTELIESLQASETSEETSASNGGIYINVQVQNTGHLSYQLTNLYLNASYYDYKQAIDVVVPIGNLAFENAQAIAFPSFTLAPGKTTTNLTFASGDLTVATIKGLLEDSQGLSIQPAIFDMLNEDGTSYAFNRTGITAQDATVAIDYAGYHSNLNKMVATKANGTENGVSIANILSDILKVSVITDTEEGYITSINALANTGETGYWLLLHAAGTGNEEYVTTLYTTPEDQARALALNPNLSNLVSSYDLDSIMVKGGDLVKLYYLHDDDGDGLSNRAEYFYGTDSNVADTDGDKLTDKQEVDGWLVKYTDQYGGFVEEHVYSDPLLTDTDTDGVSDYDEANVLYNNADETLIPLFKRNPTSNDTDGDNLLDASDDIDLGTNEFLASAYDDLDITELNTAVDITTGVVDVGVIISDVTEQGAGNTGNSITSYSVHVYRHIAAVDALHPDPLASPVNYAPIVLGNVLSCGDGCDWHLVYKSEDIPGEITATFTEDGDGDPIYNRKLETDESYQYIAYLQINGEYYRSTYEAYASVNPELIQIRLSLGTVTKVLVKSDMFTIKKDKYDSVYYSAKADELWVKTGVKGFQVFTEDDEVLSKNNISISYGNILQASTGLPAPSKNSPVGMVTVYMNCGINFENDHRNVYPCWLYSDKDFVSAGDPRSGISGWYHADYGWEVPGSTEDDSNGITKGYVTDRKDATDYPPFTHKLGAGDGSFDLGWEVLFDGAKISSNSNKGESVCNSNQTRAEGLDNGEIASLPAENCAGDSIFAGGITSLVPAAAACYELDLLVREYDNGQRANNLVADPIDGRDRANVDRMNLCRDELGIWTLNPVNLKDAHDEQKIYQLSTIKDGGVPMVYRTRKMEWNDDKIRTTMNGKVSLKIEVEVISP